MQDGRKFLSSVWPLVCEEGGDIINGLILTGMVAAEQPHSAKALSPLGTDKPP